MSGFTAREIFSIFLSHGQEKEGKISLLSIQTCDGENKSRVKLTSDLQELSRKAHARHVPSSKGTDNASLKSTLRGSTS